MYSHLFKGTAKLTKLLFRQLRLKIVIWLVGLIVVTLAAASAYPGIYPDEQSRQAFALTMENPAMVAMIGLGYSLEDYSTIGALFAHEMLLFTAIGVAIMSILLVGKSTRGDEEDGRTEMVRTLPIGRLSYLSASLIVIFVTNLLLACLIGIGLFTLGIDGLDLFGSFLYGALLGVVGMVFASFTALFGQLTETTRGTTMFSFGALIIAYLIRAIGDVSNETLALFSPLGWIVRAEVFIENDWWPVPLSLALFLVASITAFYLNAIRDIGAGFLPAMKGRKHASSFLQTPFGLILRLQRTNIIVWGAGIFLLSASFGSILGDLETYFSDLEMIEAFLPDNPETTMTEQFVSLLFAIMSLISVIPAVMTLLHIKGEENKSRIENFYSRAVSRTRLLGNYLALAIFVSILMQVLTALGFWTVSINVMDNAFLFNKIIISAFVYLPAMWMIIGLAALAVGIIPKSTGFVWLYVIYGFIVIYLGELLDFPDWINKLSVFEHVPQILIEDGEPIKLLTLILVAVLLTVLGFLRYNRRDIA